MQNSTRKMKKSEIQLFNREMFWRFLTKKLRLENGEGNSVIRCIQQTRPNENLVVSSYSTYIRRLVTRPLFRSRARVALGSELQLPMSFPWSVFPGLDQDLFPPMVFLVFWDSIPKRCKGVHCVDLGESFPTRIYLQKSASMQPRTSPSKFGGKIQFNFHFTP